MTVQFCDFSIDASIIAPIIYSSTPHRVTGKGIALSSEIGDELRRFLGEFNLIAGVERLPYYRIDAYFTHSGICVLEVNAAFVDGWGIGLNLARASGISVDTSKLILPNQFATYNNSICRPELELFVSELQKRGFHDARACWMSEAPTDAVYVYGRNPSHEPNILPYDGVRLDNKNYLGNLSRVWKSGVVAIPRHYQSSHEAWESIPTEVVLKFCDKSSEESRRANQSVIFRKPGGKSPFLRRCYNQAKLLAQDMVSPTQEGGFNCQIIILAIGNEPVTGYVQYSHDRIINDNSIHGPLLIR